jgi:ABC-type transporter Mla subunit MlaD
VIETVMGAIVLVVAAVFLFFAYTTSQVRAAQGYQVTAQFERVGSLRDGADVCIAGVKVGSLVSETLDPKTFLATVRVSIGPAYKLPEARGGRDRANGARACPSASTKRSLWIGKLAAMRSISSPR